MTAMTLDPYGLDASFTRSEFPRPVTGPGQVRVRAKATSVDIIETVIRGMAFDLPLSPGLPAVLGMVFGAIVEEIGAEVTGYVTGDEVYDGAGGLADLHDPLAEFTSAGAPVALLPPERQDRVGSRLVHLTRASAEHLFDEKPDEARRLLAKGLASQPEADEGFVAHSTEGQPAFKLRIPGITNKEKKPDLMVILWLGKDGGPFVRTMYRMAPKYWARQFEGVPDRDVIMKGR